MNCYAISLILLCVLPEFWSAPAWPASTPTNTTIAGRAEIRFPNGTRIRSPEGTWGSRAGTSGSTEDFVFPDDKSDVSFSDRYSLPLKNRMGCSNGEPFCENVDDYPSDLVNNLLENSAIAKYRVLFGTDLPAGADKLYNRIDATDEEEMCKSREQTVFPQLAKNKDGEWRYIVNQKETNDILQGVRTETCIETKCNFHLDFLPLGYRAECKQKFVSRKLLAIKETSANLKKLEPDMFLFPSCCACVLKHVGQSMVWRSNSNNNRVLQTVIKSTDVTTQAAPPTSSPPSQ